MLYTHHFLNLTDSSSVESTSEGSTPKKGEFDFFDLISFFFFFSLWCDIALLSLLGTERLL